MAGGDFKPESPDAPGWYPDPFSADGRGERYFDGKRWGSSDRPLARHGNAEPTRLPTGNARRVYKARRGLRGARTGAVGRFKRSLKPAAVVVVFLLAAVVLAHFEYGKHSSSSSSQTLTNIDPNRPPPSSEERSSPIGKPAPFTGAPGKFNVLETQPGDPAHPVAWDPCRPVHYVVNPDRAPADGLSLVQGAIARVSAATGLQFVYDGPTNEPVTKDRADYQPQRYPGRWAPVLIAWSDENADPELAGYIAGLGSPHEQEADPSHLVYVSGTVILDRVDLSTAIMPNRAVARAIVLHELGHLVGLDHTQDRNEIMFSEAQFNVRDYGPGDLRGLALLGTQLCYPDI